MTTKVYDAIVIGAGSVGIPTAFFLAQAGLKPLVIDQFASPGQGSNKAAIPTLPPPRSASASSPSKSSPPGRRPTGTTSSGTRGDTPSSPTGSGRSVS